MILYLKPAPVLIDLRKFNESCSSRLQFFIKCTDDENYNDNFPESMTPGTKLDSIGHFVLRCLSLYEPTMQDFIMKNERKLFERRLEQYSENAYLLKDACEVLLKDIRKLRSYQEFNPLTGTKIPPYNGTMLLDTLNCLCKLLIRYDISQHFRLDCREDCKEIEIEIPFQMSLSLVKTRSVELDKGHAVVPCSLWRALFLELFDHHYILGLSMISRTIHFGTDLDVRWIETFNMLISMYQSYLTDVKKIRSHQSLTARMIDFEKEYFPPCMSHLLTILRENHRLTYAWRFRFSLFLKDIGLSVDESIHFWRTEYSKSCSAASTCTHSWRENQRKYTYSIRHMYGLEGCRRVGKSKSCCKIQEMQLGTRDEGGCPFVHFDEAHLLRTLSDAVIDQTDVVETILTLKAEGKAMEACNLHMSTAISALRKKDDSHISVEYESPLEYYFSFKNQVCKSNLSW